MKTPDEIKKGLEYCKPIYKGDHWKTCDEKCPYSAEASFCKTMLNADACTLIQQLEAQIAKLEKRCDAEQLNATYAISELAEVKRRMLRNVEIIMNTFPKWISVEVRKPKRGEYVLFLYAKDAQNPVMHAKNPMVVGRYDYGMYLANGCEVKVTHWMPLPEPPKEG
jgi:hypothetical protein